MRVPGAAARGVVVAVSLLFAVQSARAEPDAGPKGLAARVAALEATVSILHTRLAVLEANPIFALGEYVTVNSNTLNGLKGPHVIFTGANLHVRSGSGSTQDVSGLTGLGNLVIGYNEPRPVPFAGRGGSHNLVVGPLHDYGSFGGFVAGSENILVGPHSSVSGGVSNVASGPESSVSGGNVNTASGGGSSVCGGQFNTASGPNSSVSGGQLNTASGAYSSVSGGLQGEAPGEFDWTAGDALFSDQ